MTGSEPSALLSTSCDWRKGSTATVQSISIIAGVASSRSATFRFVRAASKRGTFGAIALEDDPAITLRGGEIPALICE